MNQYPNSLKKQLYIDICCNKKSTIKTADEFSVSLKTLEKWITAFNKNPDCFDEINFIDFHFVHSPASNSSYDDLSIKEFEVVLELSNKYPILTLCNEMNVNRSGFYKWLKRKVHPSTKDIKRLEACSLFQRYHDIYPSHGYRWLNAKIKLDLDIIYSDNYSHKICKFLGIKSKSRHFRRYGKKQDKDLKNFPNYILAE